MKQTTLLAAFALAVTAWATPSAEACSDLIVGKKASVDGSVMISYSADSHTLYGDLVHYPAKAWGKGLMLQIHEWDTGKPLGYIPQAAVTYNVVGNMNEHQVAITESTWGGRKELHDPSGVMDYGSLIYVALQRSRSAREAIRVMTDLVRDHGYYSSGESFTIADKNEVWIMELIGKGPKKKGATWVAIRIPDDAIAAHANQARIGQFSTYNTDVITSKNCIKFAREKGWFNGKDKDFNWKMVYAAPDFGGRRYCDARVWSFFNHFKDMSEYLPWALGKDKNAKDMPLWIAPDRKLSLADMEMSMRDHYEGTALSTLNDCGQGDWEMPYRPTPLTFDYNGKKYFTERPASTQQSAFSYVCQLRSWLPREIGGIIWFANDDGNMAAYVPIYCSNVDRAECFNTPGADAVTFSDKNAFWVCNWVANMVYPRYSQMFPALKAVREKLEKGYAANQNAVETKAQELYKTDKAAAVKYLNDYSIAKSNEMLNEWKQLATYLIVKFNDMAVKPEKDGKFERTATGWGARPARPGMSEAAKKAIIEQTGDKFEVPAE